MYGLGQILPDVVSSGDVIVHWNKSDPVVGLSNPPPAEPQQPVILHLAYAP